MDEAVNVIVGTVIHRRGAYIIDKFLSNQKEIQESYPSSELVLATDEDNFIEELRGLLISCRLKGRVLLYEIVKPAYARSREWNIVAGRETIRQYTLLQTRAKYLLFLDADMTFDPRVIEIMEREIQGYDVAHSGYPLRHAGMDITGLGCSVFTRDTLKKIKHRCLEFKNGQFIHEGNMLEMDLLSLGKRAKKGFFLHISHYETENKAKHISPQPLGLLKKITNSLFVRYVLIKASIMIRYDIPGNLQTFIYGNKFLNNIRSLFRLRPKI